MSAGMASANVSSIGSPTVLKPTEVAQLLRSVAMLPPGCPTALDRDTAYTVLSQLEELQRRRRKGPHYVCCPYCGEAFDTAHGLRHPARPSNRPPRHPNPIGAAATLGGAEQAARAMAEAMAWGNNELRGPEAFWLDFGRSVLWPLLYLARASNWDMDDVRLLVHRLHLPETLVTVAAGLAALESTIDVERIRRQWDRIVMTDPRSRCTAFGYAYALVNHWQLTGLWVADADSSLAAEDRERRQPGG
jgi:hypothetical protein